jgi:hypothetical protein
MKEFIETVTIRYGPGNAGIKCVVCGHPLIVAGEVKDVVRISRGTSLLHDFLHVGCRKKRKR